MPEQCSNRKLAILLVSISLAIATASCALPSIKVITCKNTSVEGVYEDGTVSSTPKNALGEEELIWYQDDGKVEVKQFDGFSPDGKAKEKTHLVKAIVEGDILKFRTAAYSLFPAKSFSINIKNGTYSSQDLTYQDAPDGSFKIRVKGVCTL